MRTWIPIACVTGLLLTGCGATTTARTAPAPTPSVTSTRAVAVCPHVAATAGATRQLRHDLTEIATTIDTAVYQPYQRGYFNPALATSTAAIRHARAGIAHANALTKQATATVQRDRTNCRLLTPSLSTVAAQLDTITTDLTRGDLAAAATLHTTAATLQQQAQHLR